MAFISKTSGGSMGAGNSAAPLDQGQVDKIKEMGYQATPVSSDPTVLNMATPTTKQLIPGTSVGGYQDGVGNFYVVDDKNTVIRVDAGGGFSTGGGLTTGGGGGSIITTGGGLGAGGGGGITITPPPLPPDPPNFGSGKIYTRFEVGDVTPNQQETVTRALWSNNVGNLLTFHTSSVMTSTQKRYYYEVFNSASSACGADAQFSVAYGHKLGSGSADEGGQINDTPSRAIYGQYRLLCLDGDTPRFTIGGKSTNHIYVINVNRARMREYLDEGNLEINLHKLSGSEWVAGGKPANAYTGSNVKLGKAGNVIRLIDDSRTNAATVTEAGEVYNIVSGNLETGIYNSSNPRVYGQLYRRLGIVVLDANVLNTSASFGTVVGSEVPGDNAYKLFMAISGAAKYTDPSGDRLGFKGRSAEKVKSTHYFCRIKNAEYNFSNNPTYVTGSEGDLAEPTFINDPVVYVTTVGLYNERKECVAVAKVSKPIMKSFTREALIKVKLEF
jgi:hypothetical protein